MVLGHFTCIETFLTVAREKSFTSAAEKLGISQPAATQHIHLLEMTIAKKLFKRSNVKTTLTQSGEEFFAIACKIEKAYQKASNEIAACYGNDHRLLQHFNQERV